MASPYVRALYAVFRMVYSAQDLDGSASAVAVDIRADGDAAFGRCFKASAVEVVIFGCNDLCIIRRHVIHAVLDGQDILEVFPFRSGLVCLDSLFGHV